MTATHVTLCLPDVDDESTSIFVDLQAAATSPAHAAQIRSVLIVTDHDPEEYIETESPGHTRSNIMTSRMQEALLLLGKFPGLQCIHLHFARFGKAPSLDPADEEETGNGDEGVFIHDIVDITPSDSVEYRSAVLSTVFDALADGQQQGLVLTLTNLQNWDDADFVQRPSFRKVLGACEELNLVISESATRDEYAESPGMDRQRALWWTTFPQTWLAPLLPTVTRLSIRVWNRYVAPWGWGFTPKCDLRGLQFKKLESLTLGQWAITHRWQIDWLLAQPALKDLTLDNCVIPRYVEGNSPLDEEYYPRPRGPPGSWMCWWEPESIWLPGLTWADVFAALKQATNLRRIESGYFDSYYGDLFSFAKGTWIADSELGRILTDSPNGDNVETYEGGYCAFDGARFCHLHGGDSWFRIKCWRSSRNREKTRKSLSEISKAMLAVAQGEPPAEYKDRREPSELRYVDWDAIAKADAERNITARDMQALRELQQELVQRHG
jgi:hypothetical protein